MEPVRVLHIVGIMNMGGIENLLMNIYRNIDKQVVQFDFLITRQEEGIFDKEIKELGGRIYNVPSMVEVGIKSYKKNIYKFFDEHKEYNIVHCHRDALCALYLKEAKKANIPIRIAHSHNVRLCEGKNLKGLIKTLIKEYFRFNSIKNATEYFACSRDAGRWLFNKKISESELKIINNGIQIEKYIYNEIERNKIRKELNIDNDMFLIGHVGRFNLQKNHHFLLKVLAEFKGIEKNIKLCLIGKGELEEEIKSLTTQLGLQNEVVFLENKQNINEIMMAFDVFLFPSLFEGLGIVLVESQATGLISLVSDSVPKEADMNIGLLEYIPITNSKIWVERLKEIYKNRSRIRQRRNSEDEVIRKKGYDILQTTQYLQNFYLKTVSVYQEGEEKL